MQVVLFGMKHSGKSTLGKKLAREWGCDFYDVDELVEAAYEQESGVRVPIREIFAQKGEEGFTEWEKRIVFDLYRKLNQTDTPYVIALGGRTPLNRELAPLLKKMGLNVFLKVDPDAGWERVRRGGMPAFLHTPHPKEEFLALCRARNPLYERQADVSLDLGDLDPKASYRKLRGALKDGL